MSLNTAAFRTALATLNLIITRPRRPGFKGHPIEFMIIFYPYLGPLLRTPMDPFEPIWTYRDLIAPFGPI